jgi:hypothetical protein
MPTARKRPTTKKSAVVLPEDRTPSQVVAHTIVTGYSDLAPSVTRIMDAGLGEAGRLHAITLFQASLDGHDNPMRDPRNAIAAGRLVDAPPG